MGSHFFVRGSLEHQPVTAGVAILIPIVSADQVVPPEKYVLPDNNELNATRVVVPKSESRS